MTTPSDSPAKSAGAGRSRQKRPDGDITRSGIIHIAGELFAERGYADTTSKAICERAGVNLAAINYHFGSRDGLYLAVLQEVQQHIVQLSFLQNLARDTLEPEEKLRVFLRQIIQRVMNGDNWPIRVWAREVLTPSPLLDQVLREHINPKFDALTLIISELTGLAPSHPRMPQLVLSMISPCLVLLIAGRQIASPIRPLFELPADELADQLWSTAMLGLRALKHVP